MAVTSNQLVPGMVIALQKSLFRVESVVKVTVAKGSPFIKASVKNIATGKVVEKNFKLNQTFEEVSLQNKVLEFLYPEGKQYRFFDTTTLDQVLVDGEVVKETAYFLKEGVCLNAVLYGDKVFSVELPQFLELMVVKTEEQEVSPVVSNASKIAILETGAKVEVPLFIEEGDIVKVDTNTKEYIQRI